MRHLKKKRVSLSLILASVCIVLLLLIAPYYRFATKVLKVSPLRSLFGYGDLKMIDEKVNILVLGIPGGSHDGPTLSDSITVMNYDTKTNIVKAIGIPRDVWSSTLQDKINSAYAYGEAKKDGGGLRLSKAEVGAILGEPIQYAVVINFNEFTNLIDVLGGVDVQVEKSFKDTEFPIEGKENDECGGDPEFKCRYKTVSFTKGLTHMNGEKALTFVRSRHAQGGEGSDFSRNKRQQLVMGAIKERITKLVLSFNLEKLETFYLGVNSLIQRDITNQQIVFLLRNMVLLRNFKQSATALPEELFKVPNYEDYEGKYVLVPEDASFSAVHSYVQQYLK
ncbi:MAG: LCP family protein [Microgenomates group bacterium]|jgi:LCP family protein required for cell wall assembly|nr:LCP family protein [Candidatus Woesebacteria bacterium]